MSFCQTCREWQNKTADAEKDLCVKNETISKESCSSIQGQVKVKDGRALVQKSDNSSWLIHWYLAPLFRWREIGSGRLRASFLGDPALQSKLAGSTKSASFSLRPATPRKYRKKFRNLIGWQWISLHISIVRTLFVGNGLLVSCPKRGIDHLLNRWKILPFLLCDCCTFYSSSTTLWIGRGILWQKSHRQLYLFYNRSPSYYDMVYYNILSLCEVHVSDFFFVWAPVLFVYSCFR